MITIKNLRDVLPSTVPFIDISATALYSWKQGELSDTEASLTGTITNSTHPSHHALAARALVRAHLRHWDVAVDDAEESIKIEPSVIGYIAKSVALIDGGKQAEVCRVFDLTFKHCHPNDVDLLLLIKAVILFMAGEHDNAISRVGDLVATVHLNSMYCVVQAYMYLLLGNEHLKSNDYQGAIQLFEHARDQIRYYVGLPPSITFISGWKCDNIGITIRQRLCEALYTAGHTKEVGESLLEMVNTFGAKAYTSRAITKWVSDFTRQCLSARESNGDVVSNTNAARHDEATMPHATLNSTTTKLLLREWAKSTLVSGSWKDAMVAAVSFMVPRFAIYRVICEHLEIIDRVTDAVECLRQMVNELAGENDMHEQAKWFLDFKQCCAEKLARFGDAAADARRHDDAIIQYSTALSLNPAHSQDIFIKRSREYVARWSWEDALDDTNQVIMLDPFSTWGYENVLTEWAKVRLMHESWRNALLTAGGFKVPRLMIYRAICEHLETADRVMDATECFREMENELVQEIKGKEVKWALDFKSRCCGTLEDLGDAAMNTQQYDEAISQYSAALSLNPTTPHTLFVKRSKARAARGLWEDALSDANEVISLDPSSPFGYESKYVASRGAGHHQDTLQAFETMLLKMTQSPDPEIRERCRQYAKTRGVVRKTIQDAIRESPRVLIDTASGRLCNKSEQAAAFELSPVFTELISSMTEHIDHFRIGQEVAQYYRYATLSHKWEDNEPLFEKVIRILVYDLEESPTHDKLQMFCKIVRDDGLHWAWSDTCCINKADHFVLQEALVAMFKWYQGSAATIVFLRGVRLQSWRGDLVRSIWNTRAWTFQEYHASKVVRFYTEDWTPYMNLDIPNHKESLDIISEMEEATGVSARALMALRPGLDDIREKLCLASRRETTLVEDAAYSLLGIFSASLPVVYGEGNKSLGRLLAQLLTSSGDADILAWTGKSGSFNSCLPADITVFRELPTSHIPSAIKDTDMDLIIAGFRASSLNLVFAMKLYDRLNELSVALFTGQRMKLPCMIFKLGSPSPSRSRSESVFRAQTAALGIVEISTREDLSRLDSLYIIHPWIDFLLDRQPVGSVAETIFEENTDDRSSLVGELPSFPDPSDITLATPKKRAARFVAHFSLPFGGRSTTSLRDVASLRPPSSVSQTDKEMRALRLIARLRQPFGALLVTPTRQNVAEYRRVASESRINAGTGRRVVERADRQRADVGCALTTAFRPYSRWYQPINAQARTRPIA